MNSRRYRFLHFATHGKSNPNVAMSSALMLAPEPDHWLGRPDGAGDRRRDHRRPDRPDLGPRRRPGRPLRLRDGSGQYAGGEGYLGFAQALFVKGARSVVLSQWKVPDHATTLLMTRFYGNLLGRRDGLAKPLPKAEALHEAKEWLRGLSVARPRRR